jgi:type I restriction enzyme S subunit
MIEGLQPYSEYKESGQQWLGRVPAHWDLKPGHAAFVPRGIKNTGMKEKTVLSLSYGRIKIKPTDKQHGLVPESYETYQIVDDGNIIIRGTDLQNDQTSLRVGLSRNRGIISSAYLCFETRKFVTPDYGYQILNTFDLTKAIYRYGSGLRQSLDEGEIRRLPIFIPPLDEQAAIVRFLDRANRKIDGLIRAKRKLIGLLNEQKQAVIYRAVTRGLNPNAPFKPSGVPWLGDIPQHWEQHALCRLSNLRVERNPGGLPLLSVFLDRGVIRYEEGGGQVHAPSLDLSNYQVVRVGDFVLNNQQAWRGSVGVSAHQGIISPAYIVLRMSPRLHPTFANYLMRSRAMVGQFVAASKGVGDIQRQVFWPFLRVVQVHVPPLREQNAIVDFLVRNTEQLGHAIARTEREITLMQEYRTRLTADVVTGKLDVRSAAAKLPDLTQEESQNEPEDAEAEDFEEAEA